MLDRLRGALGASTRATLAVDLALYLLSAGFALLTAATSTLAPHRGWGEIAVYGYAMAAIAVFALGHRWRLWLVAGTWVATTWVPLVIQATQRVAGRTDRAQEEVVVVEHGGQRLLDTGTPYLGRDAIATLPADERLLGYLPYQPGMAAFGLPRALFGVAWWTDARLWFAVVTAVAVVAALWLVSRAGAPGNAVVRAAQGATVLPVAALTLATGGDDLPVLALCLFTLALVARGRWLGAGLAVGAAGALKLFAWPVALVLLAYAVTRGRRPALTYAVAALGLPTLALVPAFAVDAAAAVENVVRYPLGQGLVASTARSPFPGQLIATGPPGGRWIAAALLVLAGLAVGVRLLYRPPCDAAAAAAFCAYGLTAAILLMPSTRFGYLLYPAAYALWIGALRVPVEAPHLPHPRLRPPLAGVLRSRAASARRTQGE